jgi:hypothetical protein
MYSQAWQDEFVFTLLSFKKNGYYLDIGSGAPNSQSNSNYLDTILNWQGVCVEKNSDYNDLYAQVRTCYFINDDANKIDYKNILDKLGSPKRIDYLSIDIDEGSMQALNRMPFNDYKFNIITIEHDAYRFGHTIRNQERECLRANNYTLLFPDVLVPLGCGMGPDLSFEDWWIDSTFFNTNKLKNITDKLSNKKLYPDSIVSVLKNMPDKYTV